MDSRLPVSHRTRAKTEKLLLMRYRSMKNEAGCSMRRDHVASKKHKGEFHGESSTPKNDFEWVACDSYYEDVQQSGVKRRSRGVEKGNKGRQRVEVGAKRKRNLVKAARFKDGGRKSGAGKAEVETIDLGDTSGDDDAGDNPIREQSLSETEEEVIKVLDSEFQMNHSSGLHSPSAVRSQTPPPPPSPPAAAVISQNHLDLSSLRTFLGIFAVVSFLSKSRGHTCCSNCNEKEPKAGPAKGGNGVHVRGDDNSDGTAGFHIMRDDGEETAMGSDRTVKEKNGFERVVPDTRRDDGNNRKREIVCGLASSVSIKDDGRYEKKKTRCELAGSVSGRDDSLNEQSKLGTSGKWNSVPKASKMVGHMTSLTENKCGRPTKNKKKRPPTTEFVAPNIESLPQKFGPSEEEPHVPEKSNLGIEVEDLFQEMNCALTEDAPTDSKSYVAKGSNISYGGSLKAVLDKGKQVDLQTTSEKKSTTVFKCLVDSLYEKGEESGEGPRSFRDESPKYESSTVESQPLVYKFGPQSDHVPEKSAYQIDMDGMYEELNFALTSEEIGSTEVEAYDYDLCGLGKHVLELDEEIGLICMFCSHIEREIRYITPDFAPNPYGKYRKSFMEEDKVSMLKKLQFLDPAELGSTSHAQALDTVWDLIPGVRDSMYPHQCEGFEFIWRHIAGGVHLEELAKPSVDGGKGCIISHAPGTGKTRLTIVFIQSYMKFDPTCRPLIVAPRTMLLTWEEEFKKWGLDIPFHNLNHPELSGQEDEAASNLIKNDNNVNNIRMVKLHSWKKKRSILGISYTLFEKISGNPTKKRKADTEQVQEQKRYEAECMRDILYNIPGLVVFDEGHNPRSEKSNSWNALLNIKTSRRILLSGTPFQNNFEELHNTICLVRPEMNATCEASEREGGRKSNTGKGQWNSPNNYYGKDPDDNTRIAEKVREEIAPFVHVYKGSILQDKLPGLRNSVLVLHPTSLQENFINRIQMIKSSFSYDMIEAKVSIHPSLMLSEEVYAEELNMLKEIRLKPDEGVKARFTIELIRLCQSLNERVLVFSQWIDPLLLMKDLLKFELHWKEGVEIIYMDGKCKAKERQASMKAFNDPCSKAKVMLASTRGCNEGINLVGASRVVLLDVTWNPAVERQAISRAYRLGQKKIVFIYHLLMAKAREEHKYSRQVEKHRLSNLVFNCSESIADRKKIVSEDRVMEEMVKHKNLKHIFEKITLLDEASYMDDTIYFE